MTDTNVTPFEKPSPRKGEGVTPGVTRPAKRDRTGAARQRKFKERRRALSGNATAGGELKNVPLAKEVSQPPSWAAVTHGNAIDAAAVTAAVALAACAAWFSIRGMIVLFPGAPVAVVAMAIGMESTKLVTAGWLARRWRSTAWMWRVALAGFVVGLAVINASGVYAQLVAAHVGERGVAATAIETQDAEIAGKIDVAAHAVADLDARINQIDAAVGESTRRGRTAGAVSIIEGQRRARAGLVEERNREAGSLATLKAERASVAARGRQADTEAAPIRYITELLGGGEDNERAIRWLIALMVLCCDPLAIALTAAVSASRSTTI